MFRSEKHTFRYFCDGSIKTYFLGTVLEGDRSYPLELTQVGSAIVHRTDDGSLEVAKFERQILLLVPYKDGRGISESLFNQLKELEKPFFRVIDVAVPDPLSDRRQDPRDKSGAKARWEMHMLEKRLIEEFAPKRAPDEWTIIDGGVRKGEFVELPRTIGVAKSFDRTPTFTVRKGNKGTLRKDISGVLAGLEYGYRTAAFFAHGAKVAFWYVRLRAQGEVDYPLMGVVKVEVPTPDCKPVSAELADQLSSALVGERNVTPHGLDTRWHAHLYPIFNAERGRSLGVVLFSAQQFMSAVHSRVTGNCATKILGRTGASEIATPDYRFLDDDLNEKPGVLRPSNKHGGNAHAIQQERDYITSLHRRERHKMERYAGIVCDGFFFIFCRFREKQWHVEPPVPVDVYSCERFLHYLAALQTELATTPENLLRDFGENTPCSRKCVGAFYQALTTSKSPKINALFRQWARTFSEICGYEPDSPKLDVEQLARLYAVRAGARDKLQPFKLFFAIHTYYATFIKLLAVQIVNFYARTKVAHLAPHEPVTLAQAVGMDAAGLQTYLRTMEEGGIIRHLGIRNFLEGDFFGWYLEDWTPDMESALRCVIQQLANYSFVTLDTDPDGTRDLLKKLYQNLMPQALRHDLGEYYTPDWLATQLLNQLHGGTPDRRSRLSDDRLLDPACGSGTFLVLHIRDIRLHARDELLPKKRITRRQLLDKILANVVGYDLNPLAVISTRTNYLLALGDLLDEIEGEIDIPIYLADFVLTPSAGDELDKAGKVLFMTSVGEFALPRLLVKADYIDELANLLEEHVKNDSAPAAFTEVLCQKFLLDPRKDKRGGAKDDLSVLMLDVAADQYLKTKGRLGFVITQTILKTEGGGEGFRRLQLGDGEHLRVIQVDDFSEVQCFEGATHRTAVLIVQKGQPNQYPVSYNYWRKTSRERVPTEADHDEAMERLKYFQWVARPIKPAQNNFGETFEDFLEILSMPDRYIIYREHYRKDGAADWKKEYARLDADQKTQLLNLLRDLNAAPRQRPDHFSRLDRSFRRIMEHYYPGGKTAPKTPADDELAQQGVSVGYDSGPG